MIVLYVFPAPKCICFCCLYCVFFFLNFLNWSSYRHLVLKPFPRSRALLKQTPTKYLAAVYIPAFTVLPHTTNWGWYYEWPSRKNMFSFTSKHCLPPPYGCNPLLVQPLSVKQMAALLLFHSPLSFCPVMLFTLSMKSKWNHLLWNNALSARFTKIFLPCVVCDELMLSSIWLKLNAKCWLDLDPNRLRGIKD